MKVVFITDRGSEFYGQYGIVSSFYPSLTSGYHVEMSYCICTFSESQIQHVSQTTLDELTIMGIKQFNSMNKK